MPYSVVMRQRDGVEKHCVVKDGTGQIMGCHSTHDAALDQQRALYAQERRSGTDLMNPVRRS